MVEIARLQEPSSPVAAKPDYTSYVDYLEARGWSREQLTLDENNTNLVTLFALGATTTGTVIDVRCPAGQKMSIMGSQQVPRGADARTAHALRIRLANTADSEIDLNTKIRVTKEKTSEAIVQLARVFYADVNLTKNQGSTGATGPIGVTYKTDGPAYEKRNQRAQASWAAQPRARSANRLLYRSVDILSGTDLNKASSLRWGVKAPIGLTASNT